MRLSGIKSRLARLEQSRNAATGRCPRRPPPSTVRCRDPDSYRDARSASDGERGRRRPHFACTKVGPSKVHYETPWTAPSPPR